ncbi:hypothetical protein C8R45DRAFT_973542 [Mycena sanguinolenta]|nr:hypothetical protein C8R45DRAFT_973542 [Mycena sanguinolenta]
MKLGSPGVAFATCGAFFLQVLAQSSGPTDTASASQSQATLPVGSCTSTIPCSNSACCNGATGYCGYGAEYCTTVAKGGPCTSNCDAKAQCGPNAPAGEEDCPLNVCCSQYGFCGTTELFCGDGCMSNCNPPPLKSCGADEATALTRRIGYFEGWAQARSCMAWSPSNINVDSLTHLNFAFGYISSSFEVIEMAPGDSKLWSETTALKSQNPSLKVFLSIGGWTFNNPPTQGIFSALAASSSNTNTFIKSALNVLGSYGFDGIDIDWEYPVAEDRGGSNADKENYSFTSPSSYWYLQNYDLPNMLGDDAADWVNVLTYDLHGVWDSPADFIGSIVLAHTNLTEIEAAFQLYANVGVDPSRMVRIGFYGRSFELVSSSCTDPGCLSLVPHRPVRTLTFSEIESIVSSVGTDQLVFDEKDAVKYLVYNDIDWVSYDDAQTFAMKVQFANDICVGGTMVWSLDQVTRPQPLWGDVTANNASSSVTGDQCMYTGCGLRCPDDYTSIGQLQQNPKTLQQCKGVETSQICCPVGDSPQSCTWRGYDPSGICNPSCLEGEVLMGLSQVGDKTSDFITALCCKTNENVEDYCVATDCGVTTCASGFTAMTNVLMGPEELDICTPGLERTLCCKSDIGLTNCKWHGTVPNCMDSACPVGQTTIYTDYQGDASSQCVGGNERNYCCDTPNAATFSPVDVSDVFPFEETNGDTVAFTVDYDENQGTPDDTKIGSGSSGLSDDGKENDSPFSSLFISSPNAESVSSLDLESDWVVADCDATSDQPQTVNAYCTCPVDDEDCGCGHVFLGKATDTIVKMPSSCGLGPYARVVSLQVHPDQTAMSARFAGRKTDTDPVYSLSFDYAFTDIAEENGPTDMPGYWDAIIDSPPDSDSSLRKRNLNFHQPRGLEYIEKRWFGSFGNWLSKLNTITQSNSASRNFHWSDTYTIFHQEESCPNFQSSLDISVSGYAAVNTQFGYYLEAKIVPPSVQQAYVYFKAAAFTITGVASASWTSGRYELVNFGFPGSRLHLYGELTGQISLSGTLKTSVTYTFPNLDLSFGKQDSNAGQSNFGNPVTPTNGAGGFNYGFGWNVQLSGGADVHLIPSLQLGVSVLGGSLINAQVFVEADLYAGVSLTGSVSNTVDPNICITPQFGVNLNAGLTGSVLYWQTNPISGSFYSAQTSFSPTCLNSITEPLEGSSRKRLSLLEAAEDTTPVSSGSFETGERRSFEPRKSASQPAHAVYDGRTVYPTSRWERGLPAASSPKSARSVPGIGKRAVPFLPGSLFCPATDSDIASTDLTCDPYSGDATPNSRRDLDAEHLLARRVPVPFNETTASDGLTPEEAVRHILDKRAVSTIKSCQSFTIPIAAFTSIPINAYFDLANPANLDGSGKGWAGVSTASYDVVRLLIASFAALVESLSEPRGPDHLLTFFAASLFIDYLQQFPEVWTDGSNNTFCQWINNNLWEVPAYMPAGSTPVINQIGACYPSLANSRSAGIPVLEQRANEYKQSAFYVTEQTLDPGVLTAAPGIISTSTFQKQCPSLQIATLRSLAQTLVTWYTRYRGQTGLPNTVPSLADFIGTYNSWVKQIVQGIQPAITAQMVTLIPLYNGGDDTAVDVKLSTNYVLSLWSNQSPAVPANATWTPPNNLNTGVSNANLISIKSVATADLNALKNGVPAISWASTLP